MASLHVSLCSICGVQTRECLGSPHHEARDMLAKTLSFLHQAGRGGAVGWKTLDSGL